ncbi:MAG: hypothetical protein IPJ69_00815 [Deltaproteobacteria bacterium]|nr:MAG: hypothetical protein IPJ69_00815 [Deltaproteobacteria bacterium]
MKKIKIPSEHEPDYEYHLRFDSWNMENAAALLLGFNPDLLIDYAENIAIRNQIDGFAEAFSQYLEILEKSQPYSTYDYPPPSTVLKWAQSKKLPLPGKLRKMALGFGILKEDSELQFSAESKSDRPTKKSEIDKAIIQAIGRCLWDHEPSMTIEAVKKHKWIKVFGNGAQYKGKNTLRGWLSDVDPRPSDQKTKPKKQSNHIKKIPA